MATRIFNGRRCAATQACAHHAPSTSPHAAQTNLHFLERFAIMFGLLIEKYDSFANQVHLIRLNRYTFVSDVGGGFAQCYPFLRQIRELFASENRLIRLKIASVPRIKAQKLRLECVSRHFRQKKNAHSQAISLNEKEDPT